MKGTPEEMNPNATTHEITLLNRRGTKVVEVVDEVDMVGLRIKGAPITFYYRRQWLSGADCLDAVELLATYMGEDEPITLVIDNVDDDEEDLLDMFGEWSLDEGVVVDVDHSVGHDGKLTIVADGIPTIDILTMALYREIM